jgi:hypothetical protein
MTQNAPRPVLSLLSRDDRARDGRIPGQESRLVPLTALGERGVLPPIKIKFLLGDS